LTPAEAQIRAQSELHAGESLLWTGVADARHAAITAIPETILPGILFLGFAIPYMYKASSATPKTSSPALSPLLSMLVMGGPFLMFGMINLIRPIWIYWKGLSTVYAVTNQRVMILSGSSTKSAKFLKPTDIIDVQHRERPNGSGDVMIRTEFSVRARNALARKEGWLYGVPNVKEVARLVSVLRDRPMMA
jgi:hypothetical protein